MTRTAVPGGLPEWPKGAVCKTVGSAYVGSNPTPATRVSPIYICEFGVVGLPVGQQKAAVLRTVDFHRCGRMTVRFVRSIRTHQSKRSGRSTAGALRTPSDRSKIRNSRDMRGMDDEPSRRRSCASCRSSLRPEGTPERPTAFATPRLVHSCPSSILEQTLRIRGFALAHMSGA